MVRETGMWQGWAGGAQQPVERNEQKKSGKIGQSPSCEPLVGRLPLVTRSSQEQ
jgi:hypothetical protein